MARGGYRPTAPQNNPMNISARGGNGQSGKQAAKYVSGLPYGEGKELMNIQESAPLAAAPSIEQSGMPSGLASAAASQPLIGLKERSRRPTEPVTQGADSGPGADSSVLGLPNLQSLMNQDMQNLAQYLPFLEVVANSSSSSNTLRNLVRYIKSQVK